MGQGDSKLEKQLNEDFAPSEHFYGLANFGNTCYCNSVLQALYFCLPFRLALSNWASHRHLQLQLASGDKPSKDKKPSESLFKSLGLGGGGGENQYWNNPNPILLATSLLFDDIQAQKRITGVIKPSSFIQTLRTENELFRSIMQQDAHEFLMYLLNEISEALEKESKQQGGHNSIRALQNGVSEGNKSTDTRGKGGKQPKTMVEAIFQGTLTNETKCLTCESVTCCDEDFLDIPVDVDSNSSITHCLTRFCKVEKLGGKEKFHCECCGGLQEAEKSTKIKKVPKILILHLKRFKYLEHQERFAKLSHRVSFALELRIPSTAISSSRSSMQSSGSSKSGNQEEDMPEVITDEEDPFETDPLYTLIGIVIHIGPTANSGHYVACVRSGDKWLLFDDEKVQPIPDAESTLNKCFGNWNHNPEIPQDSASGYILFYERRRTSS